MTREQIVDLLRELLGEILELDPQELDFELDLIDDLDTDSLQRLELMTEVEHQLDVRLDARAWREARTLTELTELTLRELAESPSR
ncbi:MAG TPA: phosphopantetheine-binding protein [Conexibacter sp.]|nr:phosphopantetheine-binding protein [Conexibacter sp.]